MGVRGCKVEHAKFGMGTVVKETADMVTVRFDSGESRQFINNDSLGRYLTIRETARKTGNRGRSSSTGGRSARSNNYIFKCNYCSGGESETCIGFHGLCSVDDIRANIDDKKRAWCSCDDCVCRQFHDGKITYEELKKEEFFCYEATLFDDWEFKAGVDSSAGTSKKRRLPGVRANGLCVFTTVFPESNDRVIIGAFISDKVYEGDEIEEGYVKCTTDLHIELTKAEARDFYFWDYYKNPNSPENKQWGTGLYRKPTVKQALAIMKRIVEIKTGTPEQEIAERMLSEFCEKNNID